MLTDDQINENAAAIKKLLLMDAKVPEQRDVIISAVDTITSMILAFHRIARAEVFKP